MARGFRTLSVLGAIAALGLVPAQAVAGDREPKIVGGSTTTIAQHPWQAGLLRGETAVGGEDDLDRLVCGGSLITPRVVLTAAHCLFDTDPDDDGTRPEPYEIDVILGRTQVTNTAVPERDVHKVDVHPGYDPETSENDVGYLVLTAPSAQTPIRLAGSDDRDLWRPGAETVTSGWGAIAEDGPLSNTLKQATVPMLGTSICDDPAVNGGIYVTAVMVCAGFLNGGTDSCQGDSGGPLTTPAGGPRRLVGVTSFGLGCARPFKPGIYARVGCPPLRGDVVSRVKQLTDESLSVSGEAACDDTPPETTIDKGPKRKLKTRKRKAKARFSFSSTEAAVSFECAVDAKGFGPCTSPFKVKTKKGRHFFDVFATDRYGNRDTSVATRTWKVKRRKRG
ncbi:MAG: serine protease [Solirubrobacterales bacterium]